MHSRQTINIDHPMSSGGASDGRWNTHTIDLVARRAQALQTKVQAAAPANHGYALFLHRVCLEIALLETTIESLTRMEIKQFGVVFDNGGGVKVHFPYPEGFPFLEPIVWIDDVLLPIEGWSCRHTLAGYLTAAIQTDSVR